MLSRFRHVHDRISVLSNSICLHFVLSCYQKKKQADQVLPKCSEISTIVYHQVHTFSNQSYSSLQCLNKLL